MSHKLELHLKFNVCDQSNIFVVEQGQCFIAVDPNAFAPGFEGRMQDLMNICRSSEPVCKFNKTLFSSWVC